MIVETLLAVAIWALGLTCLAKVFTRGVIGRLEIVCIVICSAGIGWLTFTQDSTADPEQRVTDRPNAVPSGGYVSSDTCRSCHESEHHSWTASFHRTMTQVASPTSIVADWSSTNLVFEGQEYRLERRGEEFWVDFPDPSWGGLADGDWPRLSKKIVQVTGSHHMQVYWYADGVDRKLRWFRFVWLITESAWTTRDASFLAPPELNREAHAGEWNFSCQRCHATHARMRFDSETKLSDTQVSEFGISCEACHGPGRDHVAEHRNPIARYKRHVKEGDSPSLVNPAHLGSERSSQVCGQCHGVLATWSEEYGFSNWNTNGFEYRPGDDLHATRFLITREMFDDSAVRNSLSSSNPDVFPTMYWADGMIRVSGREYNGLRASPCFERGVGSQKLGCMSCHSMHGSGERIASWRNDMLKPETEKNGSCLQCHSVLRGDDALRKHTRHASDSTGSLCMNCHMPFTTYGLLKSIRSHTISSPSVQESLEVGRPNACNLCHLDKTFNWTGKHLAEWTEAAVPALSAYQDAVPASVLWALSGDGGQRALVAWSMGWKPALEASGDDWEARFLAQLLIDPYAAVRRIAYQSLVRQPGYEAFVYEPVLSTPEQRSAKAKEALNIWRQRRVDEGKVPNALYLLDDPYRNISDRVYDELTVNRLDKPIRLSE